MRKWMRMGGPAALAAATLALSGCESRPERQGSAVHSDRERMHSDVPAEREGREPTQTPPEGTAREGYIPPPQPLPGTGGAADAGTGGAGMEQEFPSDAGTGGAGLPSPGIDAGSGAYPLNRDAGTGGAGRNETPPPTQPE